MVFSNSDNSDDIFNTEGQGSLFDAGDLSSDRLKSASASSPISRGSSDYVPGDDHEQLVSDAISVWVGSSDFLLEEDLFLSRMGEINESEDEGRARWEKTVAAFMYEVENNQIEATSVYRGQPFNSDHPTDRIRSWSKQTDTPYQFAFSHPYLIKADGTEIEAPALSGQNLNHYPIEIEPGDKLVLRGYRAENITTGLDVNKRAAEISVNQMIKNLEGGAIGVSAIPYENWSRGDTNGSFEISIANEKAKVVSLAINAVGLDAIDAVIETREHYNIPKPPEEALAVAATEFSFETIENIIKLVAEKSGPGGQFQEILNYWENAKTEMFEKISNAGEIAWIGTGYIDGSGTVATVNVRSGESEVVTRPELNNDLRAIDLVVAESTNEIRNIDRFKLKRMYGDALENYYGAPSNLVAYNQRPLPSMWEGASGVGIGAISSGPLMGLGPVPDIFDTGSEAQAVTGSSSSQAPSPAGSSSSAGSSAGLSAGPSDGLSAGSSAGSSAGPSAGSPSASSAITGSGGASGPAPGNSGATAPTKPTIGASPGKDPLSAGKGLGAAESKISDAKARGEAGAGQESSLSKIKNKAAKALKQIAGAKAAAKKLIVALAPYWPIILITVLVLIIFLAIASTALGLPEKAFDQLAGKKGAWKSLGITDEMAEKGQKEFGEAAALALDCNSLDPEERRPAPMENANCVEGLFSSWQQSQQDYFSPIPESAGWLIPAYRGAGRYYSLPWQLFGAINGARSKFGKPNCAENIGGGVGFMRTQNAAWERYAVNSGSVKISDAANGCRNAEEPLKIFKEYQKKPKGNPVSNKADSSASVFDPTDGIYTEGNDLVASGARFKKEKEWDYTGSPAGSCTVPKSDGDIFYPPTPSFDFSGGFSGVKGDGRTLKISRKLIKLGDFYKKKWGGQSTSYKGAIPKKVLIKMLTEIWLAFGANEKKAKVNAEANYKQVYIESSGRPYASQGMCDVNGCPGDPTVAGGLFQFIPGTFDAWKVAGFNDRFNAVDNLLAGVNAQVSSDALYTTGAKDGGGPRKVAILAGQGGWGPSGGSNPYKNKNKVIVSDATAVGSTKPTPYRGKPQTDKISKAILAQGYSSCYVAIIHDWYKMILKYPPEESVSAGLLPGGVKRVTSPKKLVKCPKNIPQDTGNACYIDARLLSNMVYLSKTFQIYITDAYSGPLPGGGAAGCYADGSQCHSKDGEHPIGAAIDGAPSKGSWAPIDKLAKIVEPVPDGPVPPFTWVGYNGDSGHGNGPGGHIHLSWQHSGAPPYKLPDWVLVFGEGSAPGGKGKKFNNKFAKEFGNIDIPQNGAMKSAVAITSEFEGFYSCPYKDPVGYATIGYGHLIAYTPVTPAIKRKWKCLSKKEAKQLLAKDLNKYNGYVSEYIKVPLTPNMRAALISFTMNLGGGALKDSTLRKKLNKGNYRGAAKEFKRWNKGGGVVLPGLTRRREAERKLFLKESGKLIN